MLTRGRELLCALVSILLITLLYTGVVYRLGSIPAASGFFGHSLGVLGFLLMLMTETLYSLRKRSRAARWGRMASWLQFHIFTGLVGPYLVLLHTSWKFNGLAGIVLLLTIVIVISGFIGRYIFTAVPRTADGAEVQAREIGERIHMVEQSLAEHVTMQPPASRNLLQRLAAYPGGHSPRNGGLGVVLGRAFSDIGYRLAWWREQRRLDPAVRAQFHQLSNLIHQRRQLQQQMDSLAAARRLLAAWHAVHIPIGVALFTAAFVHVFAAIYFATLLH